MPPHEVWQIAAFAELYAQNTHNSQQLRSHCPGTMHSSRPALPSRRERRVGRPRLFTARLGQCYTKTGRRIFWNPAGLIRRSPTWSWRVCLARTKTNALKLWSIFSEKTGTALDLKRFSGSKDAKELAGYATFFKQKADKLESNRDKVPDYQNALRIREQQLLLDTAMATRLIISNEYAALAFYQLFLADGKAAEVSIHRALELDPNNKYANGYIAPALLLLGSFEAAKTEYLKQAQQPFNGEYATYRDAFLADIRTFRYVDLNIPRIDEIEAMLQALDIKPEPKN
jgi:hypothetical protein